MGECIENKKKVDPGNIAVIGFLFSLLLAIIGIFVTFNSTIILYGYIALFIISTIATIGGIIGMQIEKKNDNNKIICNMNEFQNEYNEYIANLGIMKSDTQARLYEIFDSGLSLDILHYLWIDGEVLKIFPMAESHKMYFTSSISKPDISKLQLRTIPIESILYFEEVGELRKYTTVSGGGYSFKGALAGYLIADDVGAIIGSRKPIKSEVVSEDDRKVELIYKNELNEVENLEFGHEAYEALKQLVPSKELKRIINLKVSDSSELPTQIQPQSIKEKLKQLKELHEEGLVTEEEFLKKKQKLLDTLN